MSTKIYTGFEFVSRKKDKYADILKVAKEYRASTKEIVDSYLRGVLIQKAVKIYDLTTSGILEIPSNMEHTPLWSAQNLVESFRDRLQIDVAFTVHPHKDRIFGIFFGTPFLFDKWLEIPQVREFGYYNNTDRPDYIPVKDWRKRANIWNSIFEYDSPVPSENGFIVDIIPKDYPIMMAFFDSADAVNAELASYSYKDRYTAVALDRYISTFNGISSTELDGIKANLNDLDRLNAGWKPTIKRKLKYTDLLSSYTEIQCSKLYKKATS